MFRPAGGFVRQPESCAYLHAGDEGRRRYWRYNLPMETEPHKLVLISHACLSKDDQELPLRMGTSAAGMTIMLTSSLQQVA